MNERTIEIEGESLTEARRKLYTDDLIVLEESILCPGKVETVECIADTDWEALKKAKSRIPAEAIIEAEDLKVPPKRVVLQVQGDNEESAGKGAAEVIESVSLSKRGRKGFLGFGRTQNVYEVVISQQAVVEVRFRTNARLQAKVRSYLARDLLQSIQKVPLKDLQRAETIGLLNPKDNPELKRLLIELLDPNLFDPHTALNNIESVCRKNEGANWQTAIAEAHKETRAQLRIELRNINVEIAEVFMIYTDIHWDEKKSHKPATGILRESYDENNPPAQTRGTIPSYSTDEEDFRKLETRIKGSRVHPLYLECLAEEGQNESTATLKQKCLAILKASKREREADERSRQTTKNS